MGDVVSALFLKINNYGDYVLFTYGPGLAGTSQSVIEIGGGFLGLNYEY